MLKKLAKRIHIECEQAEDYVQQALLLSEEHSHTADLFIELASEEIEHAEKLLKEGQRLVDEKDVSDDETDYYKGIWDWETRMTMNKIPEIKYKISFYRSK